MTVPPNDYLHNLGPQAQPMSRNCGNDQMALILQHVAISSIIVMVVGPVSQVWKGYFASRGHNSGQGRSP